MKIKRTDAKNLRGYYVAFEGIDGSGKDTLIVELSEALSEQLIGIKIYRTHEPTTAWQLTWRLRLLKFFLACGLSTKEHFQKRLANFFIEDRKRHAKKLRRLLKQNNLILSSRCDISTYAYQGEGNHQKMEALYSRHAYHHPTKGALQPHLTFVLNLPVEVAISRITQRKKSTESKYFETKSTLQKTDRHYTKAIAFLQSKHPNRRMVTIAAAEPVKEVLQDVHNQLLACLPKHFLAKHK